MSFNDRRTWQDYSATELRAWREFRKMSQAQLANAINYSESAVAMLEAGHRKARTEFIERCDEALETGGALMRLLKELVERELVPDWMDHWRTIEGNASALNWFEPLVFPGRSDRRLRACSVREKWPSKFGRCRGTGQSTAGASRGADRRRPAHVRRCDR